MSLKEITQEAVIKALAECQKMGQDAFLKKYGYGKAKRYILIWDGAEYDSKASIGVAFGFLPEKQPLTADQFNGGPPVKCKLEKLGFVVRD